MNVLLRHRTSIGESQAHPQTPPKPIIPRYKELCGFIRDVDVKGVVDVFGDVKADLMAANRLAEFAIARWDMTPDIYECISGYLIAPLKYPIVYDKPDKQYVNADDFATEWQFQRYCQLIELKIKTKPGYVMKAPYVGCELKLAGFNAFIYASRYPNAAFASPFKLHRSNNVFDKISYCIHTHDNDIGKYLYSYNIDPKSLKYLDNHFEICTEGAECTINQTLGIIYRHCGGFDIPEVLKHNFNMITGKSGKSHQNAVRSNTNVPKKKKAGFNLIPDQA
jgi:hypothetical protein